MDGWVVCNQKAPRLQLGSELVEPVGGREVVKELAPRMPILAK